MSKNLEQLDKIHSANHSADDGRQETASTGRGEPDEGEPRAFRSRFRHNRSVARDFVMQWCIPAVFRLALRIHVGPTGGSVNVHPCLHWLVAPEENKDRKD